MVNQKGFTFVEMLVVLFIFIIVVVTASDIFMRTQRSQARSGSMQKLQDDVRFIGTKISNDVRTGSIDYSCYKRQDNTFGVCGVAIDSEGGNSLLALKTAKGSSIIYKINQNVGVNGCLNEKSAPCLLMSDNQGTTWQSMTGDRVRLDAAKTLFFIRPGKNPFELDAENKYLANEQPRVTLKLEALADVTGLSYSVKVPFQTTIATREYRR